MPQLPGRALAKLTIIPYLKCIDGKLSGIAGKPFFALYNPTTYSINGGKEMATKHVAGGGPGNVEDLYAINRTLSIELFLDGTGASPPLGIPIGAAFGAIGNAIGGPAGSVGSLIAQASAQAALSAVAVTKLVNYFFSIAAGGDVVEVTVDPGATTKNKITHTSNYLKVIWGKGLSFKCKLQSATVNYSLFNQLGQPLRAKISATFIEEGKKPILESPDLTKIHLVKAGDTIYNIAKEEYDSESYYMQIAQANDLVNYRKLVPGQILVLPPIAKTE